jgi:hypothetical protein
MDNEPPKSPPQPPGSQPQGIRPEDILQAAAASKSSVETSYAAKLRKNAEKLSEEEKAAKRAENKLEFKRIAKFAGLFFAALVLISGIFWAIFTLLPRPGGSEDDETEQIPEENENFPNLGGFQCQTSECYNVAALPDGREVIRDTAYYIFDSSTNTSARLSLSETRFREFTPFAWGDEILAVYAKTTGNFGLFSISANRQLVGFSYEKFHININDSVYDDMQWIEGKYIIGETAYFKYLFDVSTGDVIVSSTDRIFLYGSFIFNFENTGSIIIYNNSGNRLLSFKTDDFLAVLETGELLVVPAGRNSFDLYSTTGEKVKTSDETYIKLRDIVGRPSNNESLITKLSSLDAQVLKLIK